MPWACTYQPSRVKSCWAGGGSASEGKDSISTGSADGSSAPARTGEVATAATQRARVETRTRRAR